MAQEKYRRQREHKNRLRQLARMQAEAAKNPLDLPFLLLTLLLTGIGLVMLFSASFPYATYESGHPAYYLIRQGIFAVLGIAAMAVVSRIDYHRWRGLARPLLIVAVFLLFLVAIPHNPLALTRNNATRWLGVGGFSFQPSEIAKLAVIVYFAASISKKKDKMRTFRQGILPYALILVGIALLMMLEPHLSGTILIFGTGVIMMIVGGLPGWLVGTGIGGVSAAAVIYVKLAEVKDIYGADRIKMWKDPWIDPLDKGFQMCQSLIAIGSGGLLGVGLGKSRQKFLYLPERQNDFIFAVVCEEIGLIGACIIMLIFALLIVRGFWIALHARDRFGALLAVGVTTHLGLQTFLNIAVVSGLVPNTGISLPFFSYGGTALLLQLVEMGIVLSVSRQIPAPRAG